MQEPGEHICPIISKEQCIALIQNIYGINCLEITALNGYDDKNYKVVVQSSEKSIPETYVLKILNKLDSKKLDFIEGQHAMLRHLGDNGIICPQPMTNLQGATYSLETLESGEHVVRLMRYIEGNILHQVPCTVDLLKQVGRFIGHIDNVLQSFTHSAYESYQSLWQLDSTPQLRQFLFTVKDARRQTQFKIVINDFEATVLAKHSTLPVGHIHGDFNEQNIIVSQDGSQVRGVLDFGDTQKSCYIYELAIAMAYMMIVSGKLEMGGPVLAGYVHEHPMSDAELQLLRLCILARISQSLILGAYSAHLHPENAAYLLTTSKQGTWELFDQIYESTNQELMEIWKNTDINDVNKM